MNKVKIELDDAGIQELLKSEEMKEILTEQAQEVCDRAGGTFEYAVHTASTRTYASIYPTSYDDILLNNRENVLEKAISR